jgi:hypothetical protein
VHRALKRGGSGYALVEVLKIVPDLIGVTLGTETLPHETITEIVNQISGQDRRVTGYEALAEI